MLQKEFAEPVIYNKTLNPKLWKNNHLQPQVRLNLLKIAQDFKEFVDIDFPILDITITGGNANYNYTPTSDIDLHLITDYKSIPCSRELDELFDSKRHLYKKQFDITIRQIPVELYIEDHGESATSAGCYSIIHDHWIRKPNPDLPSYDRQKFQKQLLIWQKLLKRAAETEDLSICRQTIKLLRTYRQLGLNTAQAEFSIPNLVYKSLRNDYILEIMTELIDKLHDRDLSLDL